MLCIFDSGWSNRHWCNSSDFQVVMVKGKNWQDYWLSFPASNGQAMESHRKIFVTRISTLLSKWLRWLKMGILECDSRTQPGWLEYDLSVSFTSLFENKSMSGSCLLAWLNLLNDDNMCWWSWFCLKAIMRGRRVRFSGAVTFGAYEVPGHTAVSWQRPKAKRGS